MNSKASGDGALVSNRVSEKSDLQNLNQRLAAYIQAVRSSQDRENQQRTVYNENQRRDSQSENIQALYEQQIGELQAKLETFIREKQELDMNRVRYDTTITDYENRIVSMNETVFEKQTEIQRLYGALAAKDVELQEARADATQPKVALDGARMEAEDLRKRLNEAERRLNLEIHAKTDTQKQLVALENRMQQEIIIYQQDLSDMKDKLENSHRRIIQLEDKVRKVGHTDSSLAEMMKNVREASEVELRRFMEETEAKYNMNIQEVKLRMDSDVQNLAALAEENGRLQAQLGSQAADIRMLEAKHAMAENLKQTTANELENEKHLFQLQVRNLEIKLQETQDLLLVKIQELGAAQEANIPLRAEINALKTLMEEEEKRLNLSSGVTSGSACFQHCPKPRRVVETLDVGGKGDGRNDVASDRSVDGSSRNGPFDSESNYRKCYAVTAPQLPNGNLRRRPASVPVTLRGLRRIEKQTDVSHVPFAAPTCLPADTGSMLKRSSSELESRYLSPSSDSVISQIDLKGDGPDKNRSQDFAIDDLPPRPDNPTPTRQSSSAIHSRFIPATGGQGKDYFDAMFNDLRKGTLYSKVTEKNSGPATARVSSVNLDRSNSTGSATGNIKVLEVADDGSCVRITNTSSIEEESIGGFMLQQNVGGHPVSVFRFPPRSTLLPGNSTTVWSAKAINGVHNPPHHYVWAKLDKWGTGPECTTLLCKPNGQAVAWMTSALRKVRSSTGFRYQPNVGKQTEETQRMLEDMRVKNQFSDSEHSCEGVGTSSDEAGGDGWKPDPVTLPSTYTSEPTTYRDGPYSPRANPVIKRPKSTPSKSRAPIPASLLPSRTGSAPLHLHHPKAHQYPDFIQRLSETDADIIDLTTQKSIRSKYGFDFMTHPPKVTNHDGTIR